jgi:hypothetical protein
MSTTSEEESSHSDDSNISEKLEELMWEEVNDPMEAEIEAQIVAELEAEQPESSTRRRGYTRRYINRDHAEDHNRLFAKYFCENPLYTDEQFRRRFRMRKHVFFLRIVEALGVWSPYFRLRRDAFGKVGLSPLQKCTAAIRMLAYGTPADFMDETFAHVCMVHQQLMYACIILHNMIVDDERDDYDIPDDNTYEQGPFGAQNNHMHGPIYGFADVLEKNKESS